VQVAVAKRRTEADAVRAESAGPRAAYGADFYTWAMEQSALLRDGRVSELDLPNLAEEIESLGKSAFSSLASAYRVILVHMLKWDHQPERRTRSWVVSIETQRVDAEEELQDSPGLKPQVAEAIERAYRRARIEAAGQMKRSKATLPEHCPYTPEDIMNRSFEWPEA
jgi:hypothetical protein